MHGQRFVAKAVVIAAGVGSFQPRRLKIDGLDACRERQLFYRVRRPGAVRRARHVVIVGDGDAARDGGARPRGEGRPRPGA